MSGRTHRLQRRVSVYWVGAIVALGAIGLMRTAVAAAGPADCSKLTALKWPDIKITDATAVAAATTGAIRVAHCRVNGATKTRSLEGTKI